MFKKLMVILAVLGVSLSSFSFAQEQLISPPETLLAETSSHLALRPDLPRSAEEAKEMGEKAIEMTQRELPGILEKIWKEEVLPVWQKMWNWFLTNIWPKIEGWFKKEVEPRAKEEIEKRKPIIEEEFKKEKEEIKKEIKEEVIPKTTKSLWEKFKELIK